ncbi:hypothetical protein K7432_005697 [Basidiobolus ranarum]|uniref:Uncharacterized protein n=1 Tax=Basidiobolus ranarum TaxID=34480 RepID=A0ABR2WW34_9FUNG
MSATKFNQMSDNTIRVFICLCILLGLSLVHVTLFLMEPLSTDPHPPQPVLTVQKMRIIGVQVLEQADDSIDWETTLQDILL